MTGFLDILMNVYRYLSTKDLTIPAIQMIYFLGLINILMLMRYYRITYLVSLIFSIYWLVVLNQDKFGSMASDMSAEGWWLMGGGLVVLIIALFCFLAQSNTD